jgi:predicted ATPase
MKIYKLTITDLNKSNGTRTIKFNEDINILTGKNGSGKTTILKLLWYCISGNIERAVREIAFKEVVIETNKYTLKISKIETDQSETVSIKLSNTDETVILEGDELITAEEFVNRVNLSTIELLNRSIFFPTFRRIEGGFSMNENQNQRYGRANRPHMLYVLRDKSYNGSEIQQAVTTHANLLSVGLHKFVSSISTIDIQQLITAQHSKATDIGDNLSRILSERVSNEIQNYKSNKLNNNDARSLEDAISTLDRINGDVLEFEANRKEAFRSLTILSDIISTIFKDKGITLGRNVRFGDINKSISSDLLSAGEKQMLSFLCYNAFYQDCPFFIDEPELSLHLDWQRTLLNVMAEQQTNNQLFIATHSPFIYTQYEDKEVVIDFNTGGLQ